MKKALIQLFELFTFVSALWIWGILVYVFITGNSVQIIK